MSTQKFTITNPIIGALLVLAALAYCTTSNADELSDLPANTWVKLETPGNMDSGILAFSGMALDSNHQKLLVFGGGHNNYWGNEIWSFDIPTRQWTLMYEPDPRPDTLPSNAFKAEYPGAVFYPNSNEPLAEARPLSRHTYDTVEFITSLGVLFSSGTYTWGDGQHGYCWGCDDSWAYSYDTNSWTYLTNQNTPDQEAASAAYDPVSDIVYMISKGDTFGYDVGTDSWSNINTNGSPPSSIETVSEYDSKRQSVYMFGGEFPDSNALWKYDIAGNRWTNLNPSGSGPGAGGGYGMAYDSVNDVLLVFKDELWAYNPNSNSWQKMNSALSPPQAGRIHGNFKYDSASNAAFLVTENSGFSVDTWAYRYAGVGALPVVAPERVTDLEAN